MAKYINVDEAKTILYNNAKKAGTIEAYATAGLVICFLDALPAEDVAPVVRCENCVHWREHKYFGHICGLPQWAIDGDHFCSLADKKEGSE